MRQEALEDLFATYVSEGKWDEDNVPEKLKKNVDKKVKKIKENKKEGTDNV